MYVRLRDGYLAAYPLRDVVHRGEDLGRVRLAVRGDPDDAGSVAEQRVGGEYARLALTRRSDVHVVRFQFGLGLVHLKGRLEVRNSWPVTEEARDPVEDYRVPAL